MIRQSCRLRESKQNILLHRARTGLVYSRVSFNTLGPRRDRICGHCLALSLFRLCRGQAVLRFSCGTECGCIETRVGVNEVDIPFFG